MSELALLRDWTAAHPETTLEDRQRVLRFLLECEKTSLSEITAQEIAVFFLLHAKERSKHRAKYRGSIIDLFDWATEAGYCELNPAWSLAKPEGRSERASGLVQDVALTATVVFRDYRSFFLAEGGSPNTVHLYLRSVHRLCALNPSATSLAEMGEEAVVALLEPYKPRSASRELNFHALRSFFGWAKRRGHVPADPTAELKVKGPREKDPDAYSPEEIVVLIDTASNPKHAAMIQLAYSLGLRRSELCSLTPDDVDWVNGRVRIRAEIAKGNQGRHVEMNELAVQAIEALRPYWNGTLVGGIHPNWFTTMFNQTATRAGFPPGKRNPHLLRSSFATHMLAGGSPISVVSKLLGHSKVSTTSRYLAVTDTDRHAAVGRLKLPPSAAAAKGNLRWKATG